MDPSIKQEPGEDEGSLHHIPTKLEDLPVKLEDVPFEQRDGSVGQSSAELTFRIRESASPELERASQRASRGTGLGFTDQLAEDSLGKYNTLIQAWPGFLAEQEHPYAWRLVPLTWEENGQSKLTVCMPECRSNKTASSPLLDSRETPEAMPLLHHWYRSPNAKIQITKLYEDSSVTITATNQSAGPGQSSRNTAISIDFGDLQHLSATGYLLREYKALGDTLGNEFVLALTQATNLTFDVTGYTATGPFVLKDEEA